MPEDTSAATAPPETAIAQASDTEDARLPDLSSWLPEINIWLYAVPLIFLLLLWLFCPVAIILIICVILLLWWLL